MIEILGAIGGFCLVVAFVAWAISVDSRGRPKQFVDFAGLVSGAVVLLVIGIFTLIAYASYS